MYRIRAIVTQVEGLCHAGFRRGDQVTFERPRVVLKETDRLCMWALQALIPFVAAQASEIAPSHSRIHKQGDSMLAISAIRCPDPGPACGDRGGAGSVLFELVREEIRPLQAASVAREVES